MRFLQYERRLYSGLQIFGGGLFVMNWANQVALSSDAASIAVLTVLGMVGIASAIVAILYLQGRSALAKYCLVFWALQIPTFATHWLSYRVFSGAEFQVGLDLTALRAFFEGQLGIGFIARVEQEGPHAYIGLNAIALAATIFFAHERRRSTPRSQIAAG